MEKLLNNYKKCCFITTMRKTIKNKLCGIGLIIIGSLSNIVLQEGTFLLLTILMALALFSAKEDIFERR